MKRQLILGLCILALCVGSCRSAPPAEPEAGLSAAEIPWGTDQPLAGLVPESLPEPVQTLDPSMGAPILQAALASIPAAELLGQQVVDDLNAAISELQAASLSSVPQAGGRQAVPVFHKALGEDGCWIDARSPFDKDGFNGEIVMRLCFSEQEDRIVSEIQFSVQMQGTSPETQGQVLVADITMKGDQDACPSAEGKTIGSFSGRMYLYVKGTETQTRRTVVGLVTMEAYNGEDASIKSADLALEGSVNFEEGEDAWHVQVDSQAKGVKLNDIVAVINTLIENARMNADEPPRTISKKYTVDDLYSAATDTVWMPVLPLVGGTSKAEETWKARNRCIEIRIIPETFKLAPGESVTVQAEVVLKANGDPLTSNVNSWAAPGEINPDYAPTAPDKAANFTYKAPEDGSVGRFSLAVTTKAGVARKDVDVGLGLLEWSGTFTMEGSSAIPDVGSSQASATFRIRFRADLNQPPAEEGDPDNPRVLIPFDMEEDSSLDWSGTATALGTSQPFSGSTANLITPDYENPEWMFSLPAGDYLAGEGYIDLTAKQLYLFLIGMGDNTGAGTFNLAPATNCSYYHDQATNRVYLVFPLDKDFKIADGSCFDQITGDISVQSTRSWHFETAFVEDGQGGP